jgi:signal transduction histidine kinase
LFRKYVVPFVAVVLGALLTNGIVEIYFTYRESQAQLAQIQREKANAAALRIEHFVRDIERQIGWTAQPQIVPTPFEQRQLDYVRLLKQVQPITEITFLDGQGREQLRMSRLAMDVVGAGTDFSAEPQYRETRGGRVWYGPVTFRKGSEPYMTIAVPHGASAKAPVTAVEVNLKFIWDVVSQIRIGRLGQAYVVDQEGHLLAHPDISLVLRKTDLSAQPHVAAARSGAADTMLSTDLAGRSTLVAHSVIAPLGWIVFVEQPVIEALAPLRGAMVRTGLLMLVGILVAVVASLALARKIGRPIEALRVGAARIGGGDLAHRIDVGTRDELQDLGEQFNRMAGQLQESYATLEQKVEDRTRELTEALEQQTATSEILHVISRSPTDVQPVLDAMAEAAARLCSANDAIIRRVDGDMLRLWAHHGDIPVPQRDVPLTSGLAIGRAVLEKRTLHIQDVAEVQRDDDHVELRAFLQRVVRARTMVATPLLRDDVAIGVILIRRLEVRPFSEKQLKLLQTFADQAVIAIENVRLFNELQQRTSDLSRSVGQLTALSDVSRAISSTLDLQTVLTTIVSRAVELSNGSGGVIYEYDQAAAVFDLRAAHNLDPDLMALQKSEPIRIGEGAVGRAVEIRAPVQIGDLREAQHFAARARVRDLLIARGYLSVLAVPLLVEDEILGALVVLRQEPSELPEETVEVMRTFATQSALAIQNARLFREIEAKSRQLEAANRHKDEFLASMSHELRTPLNAVIGFSEVLLEKMFGDINAKQEEYVHDILASGRHLLSLINDILDLAKIEAGRMELDVEEFDVAQAIDNAVVLVRERATRKGLTLETSLDRGLGALSGDQRKIKQVLLNLLSNAVKFTPEGGRVAVRAHRLDGQVEIAVSDTGIGIAAEDHEAVFEEFRQVGTDYAKKHEGTGLGLTLSRKFVELHGGRIWVKSAPGEGSTFAFTLPERPWRAS